MAAPKTLILSHADVAAVLSMREAVPAVEGAFAAHGRGEAMMPPKVYLSLDAHDGDFRAMPSYMQGSGGAAVAGVKWVNSHPRNPSKHGLPSVMAVYVLSDPDSAVPLAIMDGTILTAARTGAAAAVASKWIGPKSPKSIGFVGCGVQARYLLDAHRVIFGDLEVVAADADPATAERFAKEVSGKAATIEAAAGCDLVCTATPSRVPVVARAFLKPGAHVNAMGADAPGKQELDPRILSDAIVVIDDVEQATHSGEVNVPIHDGLYAASSIHATLGEIVAGKKPGRPRAESITVFDSTGLAIQDLALARVLYESARARGLGQAIQLVGG
jgi:ornithine cyclodeaminase/alanine dehydrogenase